MRRKTEREWVEEHFGELIAEGKKIQSESQNLDYNLEDYQKTGYWSALKLMTLEYYFKPYLDIFGPRGVKTAYIDLFAGPGLNLLGKTKTPVPGSPLIPLCMKKSKHDFSLFVFCEDKPKLARSLKARIDFAAKHGENIKVECQDANDLVSDLPRILEAEQIQHSLIFIDPEGCEFTWRSMNMLVTSLGGKCDIIVNFPSSGMARLVDYPEKIQEFLGPGSEVIPVPNKIHDWAIDVYRKNLKSIGLDVSTEIEIKTNKAYHYHLIPAVRRTAGGSPWFINVFKSAKERIDKLDSTSLKYFQDVLEGRIIPIDKTRY